MKLKKTLLAGTTAATLALAGTGIAAAQDDNADLPGSSEIVSSLGSSNDGTDGEDDGIAGSLDGIEGSLEDAFGDDGILGSFAPDGDWIEGIGNIGTVAGGLASVVGLVVAIAAFL